MKITIKELSRISGYSCSTISRVITNQGNVKEETRIAIEKLLIEHNYRTNVMELRASALNRQTVMIIVGDLDNWYYMESIRIIKEEMAKEGYLIVIGYSANKAEEEEEYVKMAIRENYAGLIFVNVRGNDDLRRLLEERTIPVVFLNRGIQHTNFDTVTCNNYQGGYMITEYLIEKGHRKIGHLAGSHYSYTAWERRRGYEDAMKDHHLSVTKSNIYIGDLDWESGRRFAECIVEEGLEFTAIFCGNDLMAGGLVETFNYYGVKVPEDISVVCYDDTPIARTADLTTIGSEPQKMGKRAVDILLSNIQREELDAGSVVYRPKITIRNSVKEII